MIWSMFERPPLTETLEARNPKSPHECLPSVRSGRCALTIDFSEVLPGAEGVVTLVVVGLENNPIRKIPFPPGSETGSGNEVLVRIGL